MPNAHSILGPVMRSISRRVVPPYLLPNDLFSANEQGVWFSISELVTQFQDSKGTTPVTAATQPVGLLLDKSAGLALENEKVSNGDFSDGSTDWSLGSGWSIVGGQAVNSGGGTGQLRQIFPSMSVGWYVVEFDATVSASQVNVILETTSVAGITSSGHYKYIIYIASTSFPRIYFGPNGGFVGSIDNVSVRRLRGNHALQATAASCPTLELQSNQFHLSGGSINWTAPADTYTVAYLAETGPTILTAQSLSGATNVMAVSKIFEYVAVNRALTADETQGLLDYFDLKARNL